MKPKVAYITNIAPHYREKLWLAFAEELGVEFHFFFGKSENQSIAAIDFTTDAWKGYQNQVHEIDNIQVKKRLVFQSKVKRQIFFQKWDCIILLGDANIVSNWIIALIGRARGIPVLFWGHGIYGSESTSKKWIRKSFLELANYNLVYGHWARNLLIQEGFKPERVNVIYNSVNYELSKPLRQKAIQPDFYESYFNNELPTLIFIGRLTYIKRLHLLIEAVHQLNTKKREFNLIFVGDGEVRNDLENLSTNLGVDAYFFGACYEEEKIAQLIANAALCVSPGNVGLTSVHAMSYGTPVCTNDDFSTQMPEFEAIKAWKTGCFFNKEKENLAETIRLWFDKAPGREQVRIDCYEVIDKYYNPETQLEVLDGVLKQVTHQIPKIAYFTNIAPHYRAKLWLAFANELNVDLHFFYGSYPNQSIASIDFNTEEWKVLKNQLHEIDNYKIDKRLIYQRQVLRRVLFQKWDAVILLGDANIVSNWFISIIAKLKGIPLIFWGHGLYGNEYGFRKWLRKRFLRLADYNLVYGHWAKNLLIKEKIKPEKVKVIYNSVNYELSKPLREGAVIPNFYQAYFKNELPTLIFIGRLTKVKKLHLLIEAVQQLNAETPKYNLMVIGNGEAKSELEALAQETGVNALFYGACYDEEKIAQFLANADLCVSPGNIGLTSVHAMSYGTPACTVNDFNNQGPEFEAIKDWQTGCFFDKDKENLAETIALWFDKDPNRDEVRQNCYNVIDTYYNPEVQLNVFNEVINELLKAP